MSDLRAIIDRLNAGEATFDEELLPIVYDELPRWPVLAHEVAVAYLLKVKKGVGKRGQAPCVAFKPRFRAYSARSQSPFSLAF